MTKREWTIRDTVEVLGTLMLLIFSVMAFFYGIGAAIDWVFGGFRWVIEIIVNGGTC